MDALDEALVQTDRLGYSEMFADLHEYANTLNGLSRIPNVRVVVATRPLNTDPFAQDGLVYRLGARSSEASNLVDLDCDPYRDPQALERLATTILIQKGISEPRPAHAAWEYYRCHDTQTGHIARIIAQRAGNNFLVAVLAAASLMERETPLDPYDPAARNAIPSTVSEALDKYLDTLGGPLRHNKTILLRALAYAKGDGISDAMWLQFAEAISGRMFTRSDLDELRATPIADFLLQTGTNQDGLVTRLFHQALIDQLLVSEPAQGARAAILEVVLKATRSPSSWASVDDHIRVHAAEYALDAGQLSALLTDLDFIIHADADRLVSAVLSMPFQQQPPVAKVILQVASQLAGHVSKERAAVLSLAAVHLGLSDLAAEFHARSGAFFRVAWAHGIGLPQQSLRGHRGAVCSVAIGQLVNRDVIVSGDARGTIRVWDEYGHSVTEMVAAHDGRVNAVAVGHLGDRDVIASGGGDEKVRLWDEGGDPVGEPLSRDADWAHVGVGVSLWVDSSDVISVVNAVALGSLGDRDVIVSGSGDGMVRTWSTAGQPISELVSSLTGGVSSVALGRLGDRDVIVSGNNDKTVRVWERDGRPLGEPLTSHTGKVAAVALGRLGRRDVIVSGDNDGTLRLWDETGHPVGEPLTGHTSCVRAVAVGHIGDRDVIISGSNDKTVRIWDETSRSTGSAATGHTSFVRAMAFGRLANRYVIVSGSNDKTIRLWDRDGQPLGAPLIGHTGGVRALAVGHLSARGVIVSGSGDKTVRIWDETGHPIGQPMTGHTSMVNTVALGRLGASEVIVSGSRDATVRIWDESGNPVGQPLTGHTGHVTAVALGRLGDRDVVASSSDDGAVRLWYKNGEQAGITVWCLDTVGGLAFGDHGVLVAAGLAIIDLEVDPSRFDLAPG
ncbi:MAG: WD40 repeat domain-containing protein [Propionibacteriaceae bacterium]|nr:WD40 repeat domain-containing protein [Propionibacteriaceae bacterium]